MFLYRVLLLSAFRTQGLWLTEHDSYVQLAEVHNPIKYLEASSLHRVTKTEKVLWLTIGAWRRTIMSPYCCGLLKHCVKAGKFSTDFKKQRAHWLVVEIVSTYLTEGARVENFQVMISIDRYETQILLHEEKGKSCH